MPELPQLEKDLYGGIMGAKMVRLIHAGKAKGYKLIFLSNCKHSYMQAQREYWGLDKYFSAFYCTEDFGFAPKWKIVNTIRHHYYALHVCHSREHVNNNDEG